MTAVTGNIVVRPNVGVLFIPTPAPQTSVLHWRHTFAIPLHLPILNNTVDTIACPNNTSICPHLLALANLQHEASARITDQLISAKDQIIALMSSTSASRMKRGWLNVIGKGAKSLFGLATEEDVHTLKSHIAKLQHMIKNGDNNRIADIKQLHSFQLKASDRMDRLSNHLATVDDVLINITQQFNNLHEYSKQYFNLREMVIRHQDILGETINFVSWNSNSKLQLISLIETFNIFQAFLHDIPHLIKGKLTPNIISPIILNQLLSTIDQELMNMNFNLQVACDSTYFYEYSHSVVTTLHDNTIFLKLKVPITTHFKEFSLFRVDILPVPVHSEQDTYTLVKNVAQFLLLSSNNHTFLELSANDLIGFQDIGSPRTFVPHLVTSETCLLNIFFDLHEGISKTCQIDLLHDPRLPQNFVHTIRPNEFLIYAPTLQWTVSCPTKLDKTIRHKGLFSVTLQCQCTLKSADSMFTAVDMQCLRGQHVVEYSVNWFVYTALYKSAIPHQLHPSVLHEHPINFQIPSLLINTSKLRNLEKLDRISNKHTLELFNISNTKLDSMPLSEWFTVMDTSSSSVIIASVMAVVNLALIFTVIYLFRKVNNLQCLIMATGATLKSTEALQFTLPPSMPTTTICPPAAVLSQVNLGLILLICTILLGAFLFLQRRRCQLLCPSFCRPSYKLPSADPNSIPLTNLSDPPVSPLYPSLDPTAPQQNSRPAPSISVNIQ
jgi:hypothetical protein